MIKTKKKLEISMMLGFLGILGLTGSITLYKVVTFIGTIDFQLVPSFMK